MKEYITERNTIRNLIDKLQIDDIIRSGLPPLTESLFWVMNQIYRVETELLEKEGDIILIDRYIYSLITYQYLFLREKSVTLEDVSEYISKPFGITLPIPDLSLILTAPLKILEQRFEKRERRKMSPNETELTKQAIKIYEELRFRFKNYYVLNSDRSVDDLYQETEKLFKNKGII